MTFFTDWDDLIHGTLFFGVLLPFGITFAAGWMFRVRPGLAAGLALAVPLLWFFGLPSGRFGSDDAVVLAFALALALAGLAAMGPAKPLLWHAAAIALWAGLAWRIYPAWLVAGGGFSRRVFIVALLAVSVTGFSLLGLRLMRFGGDARWSLTPAALIPLGGALAGLLVIGGATQFGQSAAAVAASIGALCLLELCKPGNNRLHGAVMLWTMLLAFLTWAGWFFADIRPLAAALLFLSPFAALAARFLPLPRKNPFLVMLWDCLAAALAVAPVLAVVLHDYAADGGDSEGYARLERSSVRQIQPLD
jgi:hypothetical protein